MPAFRHTPVLLNEVLLHLLTSSDGIYVDATVGGGGHAEAILRRLGPEGRLIGIDQDDDALKAAGERLAPFGDRVTLVHENFFSLGDVVRAHAGGCVRGILLDLGVSSFQLDEDARGFSFRADEQLDMRMDRRNAVDARQVLATFSEDDLKTILEEFGEERKARVIAREIVRERTRSPIETTGQLAAVVERAAGAAFLNKTLARVFQAIRIVVNNELENLRVAVGSAVESLCTGGRLAILTYHSLEDRIVKDAFRSESAVVQRSSHLLVPDTPLRPRLRTVTKKPIVPEADEVQANPRSRSAKLRVAERI